MNIFKAFGIQKRKRYKHEIQEERKQERERTWQERQAKKIADQLAGKEERDEKLSRKWLEEHPGPPRNEEDRAKAKETSQLLADTKGRGRSDYENLMGLVGTGRTGMSDEQAQAVISHIIANPQVGETQLGEESDVYPALSEDVRVPTTPSPASQARLARIMKPEKRTLADELRMKKPNNG